MNITNLPTLLSEADATVASVCVLSCERIGLAEYTYPFSRAGATPTWHVDIFVTYCCECDPPKHCKECTKKDGIKGRKVICESLQNDTGIPGTSPSPLANTPIQITLTNNRTWTARWDFI